jgi:hypothetical protein
MPTILQALIVSKNYQFSCLFQATHYPTYYYSQNPAS